MNGYSKDLRQKIVTAVERGMSKSQASRTFDVSLSSVKRYVNKASRGESLAPKKSPGSAPKLDDKARKLLEDPDRLLGRGHHTPASFTHLPRASILGS